MTIRETRHSFLLKVLLIINSNKRIREWIIKKFEDNFKEPNFLEIFEKELGDGSVWTFSFSNSNIEICPLFPIIFRLNFREYKDGEGWRYGKVNLYNIKELEKIPKNIWDELDKHLNEIEIISA